MRVLRKVFRLIVFATYIVLLHSCGPKCEYINTENGTQTKFIKVAESRGTSVQFSVSKIGQDTFLHANFESRSNELEGACVNKICLLGLSQGDQSDIIFPHMGETRCAASTIDEKGETVQSISIMVQLNGVTQPVDWIRVYFTRYPESTNLDYRNEPPISLRFSVNLPSYFKDNLKCLK